MTEAQSTRRDVREVLDGDRGRLICRTGAGAAKSGAIGPAGSVNGLSAPSRSDSPRRQDEGIHGKVGRIQRADE